MTPRVREALLDMIHNPPPKAFKVQRGKKPSAELVFGITSNVRTAWAEALKDAGLTHLDLHFHDLRHTPGTRVKKMIDLVDIANALGHRDPKTVNASKTGISTIVKCRLRKLLESFAAEKLMPEIWTSVG